MQVVDAAPPPVSTIRAVTYRFRHCEGCRREWPAEHANCPECTRWLGERPLERTEWQIAPRPEPTSETGGYELIHGACLILRILRAHLSEDELGPANEWLRAQLDGLRAAGAAGQGWFIWTSEGERAALRLGLDLRDRLLATLSHLERWYLARVRWGLWLDTFLLPVTTKGNPILRRAAAAMFDFEPDGKLLAAEALFQANRRWENFVGTPARKLDASTATGYLHLGHKQPSALQHAAMPDRSAFVGRESELEALDARYQAALSSDSRLALVAGPGAGKTRLISEWLARHPEIRCLRANFSLFGGDLASLVGQLAHIPDRLTWDAFANAIAQRLQHDQVSVLVIDDLHWADDEAVSFVKWLLETRRWRGVLVIFGSRPSGQAAVERLAREVLMLPTLPAPAAEKLACQLTPLSDLAHLAVALSGGNPLFVEHFIAWADEARYQPGAPCPQNLHQIIAARIAWLEDVRLKDLEHCVHWSDRWARRDLAAELDRLEAEIGLWLDRLETGDYADRAEVARYLVRLERVDFRLFMTGLLIGRARPRSSRLREGIERLFRGSAQAIFADLDARIAAGDDELNTCLEARRAGDRAFADREWDLGKRFYQLATSSGEERRCRLSNFEMVEVVQRLTECDRRLGILDRETPNPHDVLTRLDHKPAIDSLRLPELWLALGRHFHRAEYCRRAIETAAAVHDQGLAALAQNQLKQIGESC